MANGEWRMAAKRGVVGSICTIASTRVVASGTRAGMAPVSGMLCQYFIGMCWRIATGLARAGLNGLS